MLFVLNNEELNKMKEYAEQEALYILDFRKKSI